MIKLPNRSAGVAGLFAWAKEVISKPVIDGRLIENISVATTGTDVRHRLERVPRGAAVVASSEPYPCAIQGFTKDLLTVSSSKDVTISLWVF